MTIDDQIARVWWSLPGEERESVFVKSFCFLFGLFLEQTITTTIAIVVKRNSN